MYVCMYAFVRYIHTYTHAYMCRHIFRERQRGREREREREREKERERARARASETACVRVYIYTLHIRHHIGQGGKQYCGNGIEAGNGMSEPM